MGAGIVGAGVASEAGIKGSARRQMVVVIAIVVATVVAVAVAMAAVKATKARTGETKVVLVVTKSAVIAWVVIKMAKVM